MSFCSLWGGLSPAWRGGCLLLPHRPALSPIHPSRNEYISKESLASQTTETVSTGNRISPVISCRRRKWLTLGRCRPGGCGSGEVLSPGKRHLAVMTAHSCLAGEAGAETTMGQ